MSSFIDSTQFCTGDSLPKMRTLEFLHPITFRVSNIEPGM